MVNNINISNIFPIQTTVLLKLSDPAMFLKSKISLVFSIFAYFSAFFLVVIEINGGLKSSDNLASLLESVVMSLAVLSAFSKLFCFKTKYFGHLTETLNNGQIVKYFMEKNETAFGKFLNRLKFESNIFIFGSIFWLIVMIIFCIFTRNLIFNNTSYIFNTNTNIGFTVALSHNIIYMATYGMIVISTDSFIPSLMHLIAINIKVLSIEYGSILKTEKLERDNNGKTKCQTIFDNIKRSVIYHNEILDMVRSLHSAFRVGLTVQVYGSVFFIGMGCVLIVKDENLWGNYLKFYLLFFATIQLFYYCHYGEKVFAEFQELLNTIYSADWYQVQCDCSMDPYVRKMHEGLKRKSFMIMIEFSKRPIPIIAGISMELRYEAFVFICRTAYSLVATFKNVN